MPPDFAIFSDDEYALIGKIVSEWGSAEIVIAKILWHRAWLSTGRQLSPNRVYKMSIEDKLKRLRALVVTDASRSDIFLDLLLTGFAGLEEERHALVHGYSSDSALGHVIVNVRNNRFLVLDELPSLLAWAQHLREVAELWYHEETCEIYHGLGSARPSAYVPKPPAAYRRHSIEG